MKKRKFTLFERYAIWKWHEERCWLCEEPLRYKEVSIDHVFPEKLLLDDSKRKNILNAYGLSDDNFKINAFENWLPSHAKCNQKKSKKVLDFNAGIGFILEGLIKKAPKVKQTVEKLIRNRKTDDVFYSLLNELENGEITFDDLLNFVKPLGEKENIQFLPADMIILNGGYWVHRDSIAREGLCMCERKKCVDNNKKVHCYFSPLLSSWVITKGLYYKCYDELITCPRCNKNHKRGHIGRVGICGVVYTNQESQTDS